MATAICVADGNFTAGATWATVDATSLLDAENGTTLLTTSYVESQTFTPGAITIDGIAVKVGSRAITPSGTFSVRLAQAGATVAGTEVTINVSDVSLASILFGTAENGHGFYFFKFAAPVLLVAATLYTVSARTSAANQIHLYRNATAANWSRMLRTTTTGALGAGDNAFILGEWTAAATKTNRTVTMDETATTDYGGGSTTIASFGIGAGGILTWGTTAATAYVLRWSGIVAVWHGGIWNQGTTGTPCPRDSTMQLEFDCAADGDFGFIPWGTANGQGQSRTAAKEVFWCLLNTDEAAGQTVLGVDTDTGFLSGDSIAIASTTRTASQSEERVLANDAGASSLEVTVALTNAHGGTAPTQAEVVLLTRNVRIRSVSTTAMAYVSLQRTATIDFDWVEFRYLGANVAGKRGIEFAAGASDVTASINFTHCVIRDTEISALFLAGTAHTGFTWDRGVCWNITGASAAVTVSATTGTWTITGSIFLFTNTTPSTAISLLDVGGTFTSNRIIANGSGGSLVLSENSARVTGTFDDLTIHSASGVGFTLGGASQHGGVFTNLTIWRCSGSGIQIGTQQIDMVFEGLSLFGNATQNISLSGATYGFGVVFRDGVFSGDSTFATTHGAAQSTSASGCRLIFENCTFGVASGIRVAHSTSDFQFSATGGGCADLTFRNCLLASGTEFSNQANNNGGRLGVIRFQRVDQVTNVHKTIYPALGTVEYETTVFNTAAPSEKLTPSGAVATERLRTAVRRFNVRSGRQLTLSCFVRKSAAYTGSAPRLVLMANAAIGIDADVVLATHSAAADAWQQLSGQMAIAAEENGAVDAYVDCDGSAGIVYVEDWARATT